MSTAASLESLQQRLATLESERSVRECMNRYMHLCDMLGVDFPIDELMSLFTEDAVWEGKGSRYASTFGRYEGHKSIEAMFTKYIKPPAHFDLNVHLISNELINVDGDTAKGSWVLLQPSTFADGRSQLSCARITACFECGDQGWQISNFQTENLFSRPMLGAWDHSGDLPVPK